MILYNMRYRGPIEHDKFALNILQFHNEIVNIITEETEALNSNNSLIAIKKEVDSIYNTIVGNNNEPNVGLSETLYYKMLDCKE